MTMIREIGIGDYVRSYGFPQDVDCYIEGTVVGIENIHGCDHYKIAVERIVFDGQTEPVVSPYYAYPPVNGTLTSFGGVTDGVELATEV